MNPPSGATVEPELTVDGFAFRDSGVAHEELIRFGAALDGLLAADPGRGGVRNIAARAPSVIGPLIDRLKEVVRPEMGAEPFAVRSILFDKSATANWKVSWHQDVTVAVAARRDVPGFGPWSIKDRTWHVRPPADVLARMLTARLHLDPCGPDDGPLRVIPGSHRPGRLSDDELSAAVEPARVVTCTCALGGVLLMRPLLVHSSQSAAAPTRRRVLHVEFADAALPHGLEWAHV